MMHRESLKRNLILTLIFAFILISIFSQFNITGTSSKSFTLVDAGNDPVWKHMDKNAPLSVLQDEILKSKKSINQIALLGESLLSWAVRENREDLAVWLLSRGANPDGISPDDTPIIHPIMNHDMKMIKLLLSHGANPDLILNDGMTPRTIAEMYHNKEVIDALNQYGAHPESQPSVDSSLNHPVVAPE